MAEITDVETSYTVRIDLGRVFDHDDGGRPVDLGTMLALVGSLAEEGHAPMLFRELMAFRDDRERVALAYQREGRLGEPGSVISAGLEALEERARQMNLASPA